jgi:hypothetical protein
MRIARDLHGQRYGTILLRELERLAFSSGIHTLCLDTAFYRKHGYEEIGQGFYGAVETVQRPAGRYQPGSESCDGQFFGAASVGADADAAAEFDTDELDAGEFDPDVFDPVRVAPVGLIPSPGARF